MPKSLRIKLRMPKNEVEPKKQKTNLPNQMQMSFVKATETDRSELHSKLEASAKEGMDEELANHILERKPVSMQS